MKILLLLLFSLLAVIGMGQQPLSRAQIAQSFLSIAASMKKGGYSIIDNNPPSIPGLFSHTVSTSAWGRLRKISPFAVSKVLPIYANFSGQETAGICPLNIKWALRHSTPGVNRGAGDDEFSGTFNNGATRYGRVGNTPLFADGVPFSVAANVPYYLENYVDCANNSAPGSAPTLATATTGGNYPAGTYGVGITYVFPNHVESLASAGASITTTGSTSTITVTAPTNPNNGAIGWRPYITATGGGTSSTAYDCSSGTVPFGTNFVATSYNINTSYTSALDCVYLGASAVVPNAVTIWGGSGPGQFNTGEWGQTGLGCDLTDTCMSIAGNRQQTFGPLFVAGIAADGKIHTSVALEGDSIFQGEDDSAISQGDDQGGYAWRIFNNQLSQKFSTSATPWIPFANLAQGGETYRGTWLQNGGQLRGALGTLATTVWSDYGNNDIFSGYGSCYTLQAMQDCYNYAAGAGCYFAQSTLFPRTTSTNGFQTIAAQSIVGGTIDEGQREQFNNVVMDTSGESTVTENPPFGCVSNVTSAANYYAGGDGSTNQWIMKYPLVQGSETVTVNGSAITYGSGAGHYTYIDSNTLTYNGPTGGGLTNGSTLNVADGILLGTTPSNGQTVSVTYTKIPGAQVFLGSYYLGGVDPVKYVAVNAAGTPMTNGPWWAPPTTTILTTTNPVSTNGSYYQTSGGLTQDTYDGYTAVVTADTGNPSAVGSSAGVWTNDTSTLFISKNWNGGTPSTTSTIKLFDCRTFDGTHPSSVGYTLIATALRTALANFFK